MKIGKKVLPRKKCKTLAGITEAIDVMEQKLINQCTGDRRDLITSLKALGNGGLYNNEGVIRSCLQRNDEVAVEAVNALRRAECSTFRFSELTNLIGNLNGDLEVRQNAYIRAWDCPSIELAHFAEGLIVREPSDNFKNLMYSHALTTESLTNEYGSLMSGIVSLYDYTEYSPQKSTFFNMDQSGNGFDVLKLNNPGSILPRSISANMKSDAVQKSLFGAKLRAQNIENGIISIFHPENETVFEDSTEEQESKRLLGLDQTPRFRMDLTLFDNDVFSIDIDDMTSLLDELAADFKRMTEMSPIEKMKAMFGYSQEKWYNLFLRNCPKI